MNLRYYTLMGAFSALVAGGALMAPATVHAQSQGPEELTHGPVHEAFATTVNYDPEPGMLVSTAPPDLIEEIPPDEKPDGDNVAWIPGYWGWDEEQTNFIWISGIWRNLPPDRQWIPGYWAEDGSRWQWTSGYWSGEENEEVAYYSKPPKSIESGPNVAAPSDDYVWISGTWVNREDRYAWRPGYWEPAHENWTWVPAHYQWTRRGYVFVDGYWDHNVGRRGMVFAPVRFQGDYYREPSYRYTPTTVIVLNVFLNHLFVRPSYGHYYFGDYYSPKYRNEGYYDSYSYQSSRRGYDPIYTYDRWDHRGDRDWDRRKREEFQYYRDHEDARPPRTWALLQARSEGNRRAGRDNFDFAQPLSRYVSDKSNGQRFKQVSKNERDEIVTQRKEMRDFSKERQRFEAKAAEKNSDDKDDKRVKVMREKFTKSPVVAKRADELSGSGIPPKKRESKDGSSDRDGKDKAQKGAEAKRAEGDNNPDKQNKDDRLPGDNRDGKDQRDKKDKRDPDTDKKADPTTVVQGNDGKQKDRNPEGDKSRKENKDANPNERKGREADVSPARSQGESKQSEKRAEQPKVEQSKPEVKKEPKADREKESSKVQQPEPKLQAEQKQRQPEQEKKRQAQPEQKQQQRSTQAEPKQQQRQAQTEPKQQQRSAQAEPKQQRQAPPEQKQAKPQAQQSGQGSEKKKNKSSEEDGEKQGR